MSTDECAEYVKALRPVADRYLRVPATRLLAPIQQHWETLLRSSQELRTAVAGQHVPGVVLPQDFYEACCDHRALSLALLPLPHLMEVEKVHPAALFPKDYPLESRAFHAMAGRQFERWSKERRTLPWLDMPGSEELPPQPQAPPPPRGHQTFYPPRGKAASGSEDNMSPTSPAEEVAPPQPPGQPTTVVTIPPPPPLPPPGPIPPPPTRPPPGAPQEMQGQQPRQTPQLGPGSQAGSQQAGPVQHSDDYMARWLRGREVIRQNHFNGGPVPETLPTKAPPPMREQPQHRLDIPWAALQRQVADLHREVLELTTQLRREEDLRRQVQHHPLNGAFLQLRQALEEAEEVTQPARPRKRPRKGAATLVPQH